MTLVLGGVSCLLAAVVFTAATFCLVTRGHSGEEIIVGALFDESDEHGREFIQTVHQAVEDINGESELRKRIVVHKRNASESQEDAFDRLYKIGARIYFGVNPETAKKLTAKNLTQDNIFLMSSPFFQGRQLNLQSLQPDMSVISEAYLSLINSTIIGSEDIRVVPVMRDSLGEAEDDMYRLMLASARHYPRLRLTNPLVYSRSEYSRSDAFQVVNSLGATEAGSVILALSTDILPDILGVTHINPELNTRRWVAVSASHLAPALQAGSRGRSLSLDTRLTTLAYLGHSEDEAVRQRYLWTRSAEPEASSGSVYANWLLYKAVRDAVMNAGDDNQKVVIENDDITKDNLFVSLSLKTDNDIKTVPQMPWLAEEIVKVNDNGGNVVVDKIKSVSINLGDIWQSVRPRCDEAMFHYIAPGGLYMGPASLSLALTEDTEAEVVMAPLMSEATLMSVSCDSEVIQFSCQPRETSADSGHVSCEARTGELRRGRELDEPHEFFSAITLPVKTPGRFQKLAPGVVGCSIIHPAGSQNNTS